MLLNEVSKLSKSYNLRIFEILRFLSGNNFYLDIFDFETWNEFNEIENK